MDGLAFCKYFLILNNIAINCSVQYHTNILFEFFEFYYKIKNNIHLAIKKIDAVEMGLR